MLLQTAENNTGKYQFYSNDIIVGLSAVPAAYQSFVVIVIIHCILQVYKEMVNCYKLGLVRRNSIFLYIRPVKQKKFSVKL